MGDEVSRRTKNAFVEGLGQVKQRLDTSIESEKFKNDFLHGVPSITVLQEWYEEHWKEAEDVTPEILRAIERHTQEYSPFLIYAKALQEFFRGHEMTTREWELAGSENGGSRMFPVLDQYQKEGYHAQMKIATGATIKFIEARTVTMHLLPDLT
jgi:hypothetical protein